MKINIGSTNQNKVNAVRDAFSKYFKNVKISAIEVDSGVSNQPMSMKDIVKGAKNRAVNAYTKDCDFSVGVEAGLFVFPEVKTSYLDVNCCAIFDGRNFFLGLGPAFEYPEKVLHKIITENKEASDAFDEFSGSKNIKHKEGIVGILTKGRMKRQEFIEQSVLMALTRVVSKEMYE